MGKLIALTGVFIDQNVEKDKHGLLKMDKNGFSQIKFGGVMVNTDTIRKINEREGNHSFDCSPTPVMGCTIHFTNYTRAFEGPMPMKVKETLAEIQALIKE